MISTPRLTNGARLGLAAVLVLGAFLAATNLPFAKAATFVVNSTADTADLTPGDGTCEISTGGACTLRAAVEEANALSGADVIQVPAGTYTLGSVLPITSTISIAPVNAPDAVTITGAAIFQVNTGGDLTLARLTLSGASTSPAIDMTDGVLAVSASTIRGNAAGGIRVTGGVATIQTTTISGNSGGNAAGVEAGGTAVVSLTHVTVAANAGGLFTGGVAATGGADVTVSGSILADNTGASADCEGAITTSGANIIETPGGGCVATGTPPTNVDPALGALGSNGGPTTTQVPANTSAAIDAAGACSGTDQRGVSRARGSACDLGAVELPVITFTTLSYSATDSNTTVSLAASIGSSVPFSLSVPYSLLNGSAVSGTDFSGTGGSFTFLSGVATASSNVTILRRPAVTGDLAFSADFGTTNAVPGNGPASISITDVDPVVSWWSSTYTVGEAAGTLSVVASLNSVDATGPVTVTFQTVENGSARQTVEYTPITSTTIVVPANTSSFTGTVSILDNSWDANGNKTFTVRIVSTSRGTLGTPTDATVTITDDEALPQARLGASTYPATEPALGSVNLPISVTLPYTSEQAISVSYTTVDGAGAAGAVAEADYAATTGNANIAAGSLSTSVNVPILSNGYFSGPQTFSFSLTSQSPGGTVGSPATATINLADEDAAPPARFGATTYSALETDTNAVLVVTVPYTSEVAIGVGYSIANGTATAGSDFVYGGGTITATLAVSTTALTINVPIINNDYYSGPQDFVVSLSEQSLGSLGSPTSATVNLSDNEAAPTVSFSAASFTGSENAASPFSVDLVLNRPAKAGVSVPFSFTNGAYAINGLDYTLSASPIVFASLATTASILVTPVDNSYYSLDRTFSLALGTPSIGSASGQTSTTVTLVENELPPSARIATVSGGYAYPELGGSAVVTVTIPYTSTGPISFSYSTSDASPLPSAQAGQDYVSTSGLLQITAGQRNATINIPLMNNGRFTGNQFFNFTISGQSPGNVLVGEDSQSITIIDAQQQPEVQFALPSYNVPREVGTAPITVTLSSPSAFTVTVAYTMANGTAQGGIDYTPGSGTLTFVPGVISQRIFVPIMNSGLFVGDRIFSIGLSNPSQATLGDTPHATVLLRDNAQRIYLSQIRKFYEPYGENEPNGTLATAKGPLTSGATYRGGYNADQIDQYGLDRDTWMFTVLSPGQVTVTVISNDTGRQVKLLNASGADIPGGFSGDPGASTSFTVNVTAAGTYYVRVFSSAQLGSQQYQLRVTHP